ncbi:MAG: 1-acyl-sn-glycerol-3-phosphate acyltransferase, partial [Acidimicrobiales bacterium]|nr:1-acyl-sn-glycerol-3-phosphate acyltransferase [Acidimicrobiales bacterium]
RRDGGSVSQRALDTASDVLRSGQLLGFYPEGTRAPDERLHRGHTGVVRVARSCGVPVIPVGISGTRQVQPPGRMIPRPFRRVTVRFGPPLPCGATGANGAAAAATDEEAEARELRLLTDRLMTEIARLSGQEYVDRYAKRSPASGAADSGPAKEAPTPAVAPQPNSALPGRRPPAGAATGSER